MTSWPTATNWPTAVNWPTGVNWPPGVNWPGGGGPPPFDGNFATVFPGAIQVLQSDKGLQYGAVMRADPGNTSGVAFALTGATPAVPVPIWIRVTGAGVGNVYYDGLGVTPAMVGVTITDSVPIILTGAALGMAITPGVGSQVAGNTWRATCSQLADQSGNGWHATQLLPGNQFEVGAGFNGRACLVGSAAQGTVLRHSLLLPDPAVTPFYYYAVLRTTPTTFAVVAGSTGRRGELGAFFDNYQTYSGAGGTLLTPIPVAVLARVYARWSASVNDSIKAGSGPTVTGVNLNSGPPSTGGFIGAIDGAGGNSATVQLALLVTSLNALTAPQMLEIDAQANTYWGSVQT